ncbi:hypothetical protein Taro_015811 [Colocasia esculenta]|uniref:Myb/SANT-like domain-containing protein n=1 Tax=Colocasia esculenta TaxID=4460 RepID=A0A843UCA8_COLES|nr:hypothetical protein [Colocasia esculenta]
MPLTCPPVNRPPPRESLGRDYSPQWCLLRRVWETSDGAWETGDCCLLSTISPISPAPEASFSCIQPKSGVRRTTSAFPRRSHLLQRRPHVSLPPHPLFLFLMPLIEHFGGPILRWIPSQTSTQGIAAAAAMWPTSPPTVPIALPEAIPSYLSLLAPPPSSLCAASLKNPPSGNMRDENPLSFSPADPRSNGTSPKPPLLLCQYILSSGKPTPKCDFPKPTLETDKILHPSHVSWRIFKNASWTTIAKLYNAAMGENSTWIQVKEHFKSLKRKFVLFEELLKLSGWGWDPETQTPIPGYEGAWDEALRVNSRFSTIRRKPFPLYDQMQMLCKNSICTGSLAEGLPRAMNGRNVRERSPTTPTTHVNDFRNAIPPTPTVVDDLAPDLSQVNLDFMMSFSAGKHKETPTTEGSPMTQNTATSKEVRNCRRKEVGNKGKRKMFDKDVGSSALQMIAEASRERNAMLERDDSFEDDVITAICSEERNERRPCIPRRMMNTSQHTRQVWVNNILTGHEKRCYNVFRVHPQVFARLKDVLVSKSLIRDSRHVSANEQLAMFLYAVGHGVPTGVLMEHFQHSSHTISHNVNKLAFALASLAEEYILQPNVTNDCHPYIATNERFYPYFKAINENVDAEDVDVPIAKNINATAVAAGRTYIWSDDMDFSLLGLLEDEIKLVGGAGMLDFSEKTLKLFANGLNAIRAVNYPWSKVKARITFYKALYYTIEDMVGTGGFTWDVDDNLVYGNDLQWNEYIAIIVVCDICALAVGNL